MKMRFLKKKTMRHIIKRIQNKSYQLGTFKVKKLSLSSFDDKR